MATFNKSAKAFAATLVEQKGDDAIQLFGSKRKFEKAVEEAGLEMDGDAVFKRGKQVGEWDDEVRKGVLARIGSYFEKFVAAGEDDGSESEDAPKPKGRRAAAKTSGKKAAAEKTTAKRGRKTKKADSSAGLAKALREIADRLEEHGLA